MVRYYGFYSNKSRGLRKKAGTDDQVPALIDSDISRKAFRKNWARLIQKIHNVNPLVCSKCMGTMKIISFIEEEQLVKKILKHLDLWDVKRKPPPYLKRSTVSKRGYLLGSDSPDGRFVCPICATPFSEANFSFGIVISGQ
jgi:hypothetical protein